MTAPEIPSNLDNVEVIFVNEYFVEYRWTDTDNNRICVKHNIQTGRVQGWHQNVVED